MKVKQLLDLGGRTALITGGSRGLGLQIAEALGEMGAKLALTARKKDELDAAVAHLAKQGIEAAAWICDLGRRETIPPAVEEILARYRKIDILVNNAGATWGAPLEEHPVEAWDKVVGVNLTGTFVVTQLVGKRSMIPAKWGRIINIASVAGLKAQDPRILRGIAYNTTKAGLVNFTRAVAAEWGGHGITANAICPGFFPSKMSKVIMERAGQLVLEMTPNHRFGTENDLKGLAVLLASDASSHITGQAIAVDGGASIV